MHWKRCSDASAEAVVSTANKQEKYIVQNITVYTMCHNIMLFKNDQTNIENKQNGGGDINHFSSLDKMGEK